MPEMALVPDLQGQKIRPKIQNNSINSSAARLESLFQSVVGLAGDDLEGTLPPD